MNEINNKLDGLSELVTRIDAKILDINTKLDELIKALHEYDDENIEDINEGYGESSFEAFQDTKNDIMSWDVDGAERRMDIIGQNGNEGLHYDSHHVTNKEADEDAATFNDYGMRVETNKINKPANTNVDKKKRNKRKYYKPKAK
jgi:hypothetical protein